MNATTQKTFSLVSANVPAEGCVPHATEAEVREEIMLFNNTAVYETVCYLDEVAGNIQKAVKFEASRFALAGIERDGIPFVRDSRCQRTYYAPFIG